MRYVFGYALFFTGLAALVHFLGAIDWSALQASLGEVNALFLMGAVAASLVNIATKAVRWRLLIRSATKTEMSFMLSLGSIYAGVASSSLVPGRAVDLAKPLMLRRFHGVPLAPSTTAMLVERLLDMLSVAIIFLLAAVNVPAAVGTGDLRALSVAARCLLTLLGLFVALPRKFLGGMRWAVSVLPFKRHVKERIASVLTSSLESLLVWRRQEHFGRLMILSLVSLAAEVVRFYCVFRSMGPPVAPWGLALVYMASILVAALSLIPGGLGITESCEAALLHLAAAGTTTSEAERGIVLLDRFLSYYLVVLIGAVVLLWCERSSRRGMATQTEGPDRRR